MSFPTLPDSWIDHIFSQLALTYGNDWVTKWEGLEVGPLKAAWARELGGFMNRRDALAYALEHLPVDRPPNALQFRVICMAAPRPDEPAQPQLPAMPEQKADISRLRKVMERYKELQEDVKAHPRRWAQKLRNQDRLTLAQAHMVQDALRLDDPANSGKAYHGAAGGTYEPIANDCLPPGMRKKERA